MLEASVWGQSGTSVKERGCYYLVSEYEAQRTGFKAYVHWDRKGSNPITTLYSSCIPLLFNLGARLG